MEPKKRAVYAVAALALATASAALRYLAFQQSAFATGWDSYFYLVQLKSIVTTGRMHSPEASLIYPYFLGWYCLSGDYITAFQLGNACLCGVFTLLACTLAGDPRTGLCLGGWTVFSPHLVYFAAQYPKNLLGLVLFVAFVWSVEKAPKGRAMLMGAALLLLNYFGHRLTFGFCVLYLLFRQIALRVVWRKRWTAPVLFTVCLLTVAARRLPGLAHFADLQRLGNTFSATPQCAFWSFISSFGSGRISPWWLFETICAGLCLLLSLPRMRSNAGEAAWWACCVLMLFPFLEWDYQGLAWRLFLVFVPVAPLLLRSMEYRRSMAWTAALMLGASLWSWKSYSPALHDPQYYRYAKIASQVQRTFEHRQAPELIIAHNALAEYITFQTGIDAMPWLPEYPIDSMKLWRIAAGPRRENLCYHAGGAADSLVIDAGGDYHLLPEYLWRAACTHAAREGDEYFAATTQGWRNPERQRPDWLLKRKRK